ncbi:MAG: IS3 family transposase [Janthinobacterium lividum]
MPGSKKNLASTLSRSERLALLEREDSEVPLIAQADILSVSRASLYYQPVPPSAEELVIKRRIDELYTAWPFYGSRRIHARMEREGQIVNRKAVQRHMQEMGLVALGPRPNTSRRNKDQCVYPYLLRDLRSGWPNHVWGIDITYIRLEHGWVYLVAVLDWFSRYVVAWELDQTLEMPFVLSTIDRALLVAIPDICNSDQGSHFTSPQYLERLRAKEVQISMDGKGRALDNIFTECLWRNVPPIKP